MSRLRYVEQVISEFATSIDLPACSFDQSNRLSLTFDEYLVTFSYHSQPFENLSVHVDLGDIPAQGRAHLLALLELNGQSWMSGVMTIGLNPAGDRIIGMTLMPVSALNRQLLTDTLQNMLRASIQMTQLINNPEIGEHLQAGAEQDQTDHVEKMGYIRV